MHLAFYIVLGHAVGAVLLGWVYFRRYQMTRPPIGVFNLLDVLFLLVAIILVPFLYLALPAWIATGVPSLAVLGVLYITWEPVLRARWAIWSVAVVLLATDIGTAILSGATSTPFFAVNNAVLIVAVVGATNLWAQSGMRARDVTLLATALAVYDFVATSQLLLMDDLISQLAGMPLSPQVAWNIEDGLWLGIGLGDLLLATVFPLVMRKAFGRSAGMVAIALTLVAIGTMLALLDLGIVRVTLPAMVVLGPLMVIQYIYWRRQRGQERTTWQYLQAEPLHVREPTSRRFLSAAVER